MVKFYSLEIYTRNTMWYPGLNPGTEKGHQWKSGEILTKSVV